jgi:hypothetical protein
MQIGQIAGAIVLYATGYLFIDMAIIASAMAHGSGPEHRTHSKTRRSRGTMLHELVGSTTIHSSNLEAHCPAQWQCKKSCKQIVAL